MKNIKSILKNNESQNQEIPQILFVVKSSDDFVQSIISELNIEKTKVTDKGATGRV